MSDGRDWITPALTMIKDAQYFVFSRQIMIQLTSSLLRLGVDRGGQVCRLVLVEHVVGDIVGILFEPKPPVTHESWQWLQLFALMRTIECNTGEARVQRSVL